MRNAGASGYLLKNSPLEEVLNAIRSVAQGNEFYDASIDLSILSESSETTNKKPILSKSEREILQLIGLGKTTSEIAAQRFTAVSTVEKTPKEHDPKTGAVRQR